MSQLPPKPAPSSTCWVCDQDASASCQFCGRFVCKSHAHSQVFPMAIFVGKNETPKVLVVANAIWCGICRPQQDPMEIPEIY